MIYFDSNYILKCYLAERGSSEVLGLAQSEPGRACAFQGRLEICSGIKRHVREGNLSITDAEATWQLFIQDETAGLWSFLPIDRSLVELACAKLATLPNEILCRAADALHLTCAAHNGFQKIYSNDRHLLGAAAYFGVEGVNVIDS